MTSPNNDLGTAHGRIKIDVDDRGAKQADRSLSKFERTLKQMQRTMAQMQRGLTNVENELKKANRQLAETDRTAQRSESSLRKVAKTLDATRVNAIRFNRELGHTWSWLNRVHDSAQRVVPPLALLGRVMRDINRNGAGGITGFSAALLRAGAAGTGIALLGRSFLGLNSAMSNLPRWQKNLVSLSSAALTFGGAYKLFRKFRGGITLVDAALAGLASSGHVSMKRLGSLSDMFRKLPRGIGTTITGLALVRQGLSKLSDRFGFLLKMPLALKLAVSAAFIAMQAAIQASAKGLTWLSNLFVGLLASIKQIAGAALAIPGAIATIGVAGLTLKAVFTGVGKIFENLFKAKTLEEMKEALNALSPEFQSLGKRLLLVKKNWDELTASLAQTALQGVEGQIESLSNTYLPLLGKQMKVLTNEFVETKNRLVDFLTQGETAKDVGLAFIYTQGTVQNLNNALIPFLQGMKDLVIVGMEFIRNFTAGSQGLTERFAEWARANRENGNLMQWMQDGVQGAKDLVRGLWELTQALWQILTLFSTVNPNDDFLGNFADSMQRFNETVERSKAVGALHDIANAVKNIGTDKVELFQELWGLLSDALESVLPFLADISEGFRSTFLPILEKTIALAGLLIEALTESGLGQAIGIIIGIVTGLKVLGVVIGTARAAMMVFVGTFAALRGAGLVISGLGSAMAGIVPGAAKAGAVVRGFGATVGALGGPIGAAIIAIGLLWMAVGEGNDGLSQTAKNLEDQAKAVDNYSKSLKNAFVSDRGFVGANVFEETKNSMQEMLEAGSKVVDEAPGWQEHLADFFKNFDQRKEAGKQQQGQDWLFGPIFNDSADLNAMQDRVDAAKQAKESFEQLGVTTDEMAQKVSGSETSFNELKARLLDTANGGEEAVAQLQKYRDQFVAMQQDFAKAGPGGAQLAAGIKALSDAGGDATSKLTGLKLALQGLGLLQTSAHEAAFAYAEAVRNVATEAQNAVDSSAPLNDILNATGDNFNYNSVNGQNLFNVLNNVAQAFLDTVANGTSAADAYGQISPRMGEIANAFNLTEEQVKSLISTLGVVPSQVDILMQLTGQDAVLRGVTQVALQAQQWADTGVGGINIPIIVEDPAAVEARIESMFGDIADSTDAGIKFKFDVDPGALQAVWDYLATQGIKRNADGSLAAPVAPAPAPAPGKPASGPTTAPKAPAAAPAPAPKPVEPPPAPPAPVNTKEIDAANAKITELEGKLKALSSGKIEIELSFANIDDATAKIDSFMGKIDQFKAKLNDNRLEFTIIAKGYDETVAVVNRVTESVTRLLTEIAKIASQSQTAFSAAGTSADQFNAKIVAVANQMRANGNLMMSELAAGMLESKHLVDEAGGTIAQAVNDYLQGRSPTKKGPLSGRGWTKFSGERITEALAEGMSAQTGAVDSAGAAVAGSASAALQGPYDIGKTLGRVSTLVNFASKMVDTFQQISDTVFNAFKFMSDPLGKGTFFGQTPGAAFGFRRDPNVSDDDLRRAREDKNFEQRKQDAADAAAEVGKLPVELNDDDVANGLQIDDEALLSNVPIGDYSQTGNADLTQGLADCSSAVEDLVNMMDGKPTGGRSMSTENAAEWLAARGFIEGEGGLGDMRVAFNSGHMQATLPGGTNFNWGSQAAAQRRGIGSLGADDPALTSKYYRPADGTIAANTSESVAQQEDMLRQLRETNANLDAAITSGTAEDATTDQQISALTEIQRAIDMQATNDTALGRQQLSALESVKSDIMSAGGLTEGTNPIDQAQGIANGAMSIAKDVFAVIDASIKSVGAAQNIADTLVRGISNSEDIYNMVDQVQEFINLAARVAGAVGSIASTVGSFTGGMDMGGTSAAGSAASLISGALDAVNGVIDLAQEAYRIFGSYFGEFLGFLTGAGGQLEGNVRFLLDENDKTLKAYSQDNPMDKRNHALPWSVDQAPEAAPQIGEVNVYGGPGQDPRDQTRNMMFAVRSASMGAGQAI